MSRNRDCFVMCLVQLLCLAVVGSAAADEAVDNELTWSTAFEPLSAATAADHLVFVVITNDDPFQANQLDKPRPLWCTPIVDSVFKQVLQSRADLKDRYVLQSIAAGLPKLLTDGNDRNQPDRAILALCDSNYRLLAFQIGVPDKDEMLTLIEDAQFVQTLQKNSGTKKTDSTKRFDEIVTYHSKRMPRLWREALAAMTATVRQDAEEDTVDTTPDSAMLKRRTLARIGESFEEIYLKDVAQRFAFRDVSDLRRLAVIEQHRQARQPWCDAMLPFVAGSNLQIQWPVIAELVWKQSPVTNRDDDAKLLSWWDNNTESKTVVFALDPPILNSLRPWPPINVDSIADKRNLGWKDLEDVASKHAFRHVNAEQLATLLQARDLKPIDVQMPSRARYIVFEPKRSTGLVIHEDDLPAKHIGRLKRAIKK